MSELTFFNLPNGIRVIHRALPQHKLVFCGFIFNVGSRDEAPGQVGLAHFTEHMLFKGTHKRKAFHILNRLDSVGGELNAFTTKEKTSYYAITTRDYLERAFELLQDMTVHSVFPAGEIEKERQVIADEIDMYADNPEESIQEDFEQLVFPDHPLGKPILGAKTDIERYDAATFFQFFREKYVGRQMCVSLCGDLSPRAVEKLVEKYLAPLTFPEGSDLMRTPPGPAPKQDVRIPKNVQQAHLVLGGRAYPVLQDHYHAFCLLNYHLGGPAMNNRLNMQIREKYGLTYNLYSFYTPYMDSGVWGIYAGCDAKQIARVQGLVQKELTALCKQPLTEHTLARYKRQYIGHLTMGFESASGQMLGQAKDLLDFDKVFTLAEAVTQIEAITAEEMLAAAQTSFHPDLLSSIYYEPTS